GQDGGCVQALAASLDHDWRRRDRPAANRADGADHAHADDGHATCSHHARYDLGSGASGRQNAQRFPLCVLYFTGFKLRLGRDDTGDVERPAAPRPMTAAGFGDLPVLADIFRIAFEKAAAGISVAAPNGRYLHANRAFCEFVGYSLDELRSLTIRDLMDPEEQRRGQELFNQMLAGQTGESRWERRYVHKSGLRLWALLTTTLVRDDQNAPLYFLSQVIDVSDRKVAEEAVQRADARSRALLAAMQDVIVVLDRDGTYVDVAPSATDRLYRPPHELLGRRLHEIFPADQANMFLDGINRALDGVAPVELAYELDIRGEHLFFEAAISPLPEKRVVFVARDVSARKRTERALRDSEDQLRQAQ